MALFLYQKKFSSSNICSVTVSKVISLSLDMTTKLVSLSVISLELETVSNGSAMVATSRRFEGTMVRW